MAFSFIDASSFYWTTVADFQPSFNNIGIMQAFNSMPGVLLVPSTLLRHFELLPPYRLSTRYQTCHVFRI